MKSPTAAGTRMPLAMVAAWGNGSAKRDPASNAFAIGAQPVDCTLTMRGMGGEPSVPVPFNQLNWFSS